MLNKFKAIYKKINTQYNESQLQQWLKWCRNTIEKSGKFLANCKISANSITIFGFMVGILAINFLALNMYLAALLCILFNRLGDALDGAVAKVSGRTKFGIFLDACLDYIFYAGVIFGFALAQPENAVSAAFLLFGFTASACALLAFAIVDYCNKKAKNNVFEESPFYLGGLAQGAETLTVLVILCLVPSWFVPIALMLGCWCLIKTLALISGAYYSFVIKGDK